MKLTINLVAALVLLITGTKAYAWSNHALGAYLSFKNSPLLPSEDVVVESFDAFLAQEHDELAKLYDALDAWTFTHHPRYPAYTDVQKQALSKEPVRRQFFERLRLNGDMPLTLFVQPIGQENAAMPLDMPYKDVAIPALVGGHKMQMQYSRLAPQQKVNPLLVLATACDEPDLGFDIALFEDNISPYAKKYGFGRQPFGNPILGFASQGPFHMGYFHESWIIFKAAPFLTRTYPEVRIHQFLELSRLAFRKGHTYWGLRFAGWGLHYIQDLTQPYHAQVLPGASTPWLLWVNFLDILGFKKSKTDLIQLVSNRHLVLENYHRGLVASELASSNLDGTLIRAFGPSKEDTTGPSYSESYVRNTLTALTVQNSVPLNDALLNSFPHVYVDDPNYFFGVTEPNLEMTNKVMSGVPRQTLNKILVELSQHFGKSSRFYLSEARK